MPLPSSSGTDLSSTSARATSKWGDEVMSRGFTLIPNLLLTHQSALGLSSVHCMLLIQLITYWWESGKNPFPSKATLAQRMGVSERQIQRYLSDLTQAGFIRRQREGLPANVRRGIMSYDLSGLVEKLQKLEALSDGTSSARRRGNVRGAS